MPLAADFVTYLDPLIADTAGVDLFEGPATEQPDNVVVITHSGGEAGEYTMGPSLSAPGVEVARIQLMVRHTDKTSCVALANTVHALLANLGPVTITGRVYHHVENIDGEPYTLGVDDNARWRYVANYRVFKQRG